MPPPSAIVVGSLNIDDVFTVQEIVQGGQTISSLDYSCYPGGKG